jgi:hypothetical protein
MQPDASASHFTTLEAYTYKDAGSKRWGWRCACGAKRLDLASYRTARESYWRHLEKVSHV